MRQPSDVMARDDPAAASMPGSGAAHGGGSSARLLGRTAECEALDRLAAEVAAGSSRVLVLRGDAGAGKTALLAHLSERTAGWTVVSAVGVESEMELAYGGLHQVCVPLLPGLEKLPEPQRNALATVFGLRPGPPPDRFLVGLATLTLLADAAEERPLACLVDDAQWLDQASAQILGFVARRLLAERVALVCAARLGIGDQVLAGLPALEVRGLPDDDARALLLATVLGPLDTAVTDRIVAESHGNPLALLELPRTWSTAELAGGFGLLDARPVAGKIEQSFLRRLRLLPTQTQLLVLAAAAEPLGDPLLLHRAAEVLGIDAAATTPAVDAGLLEVHRRVEFAHPLVRSATYGAAGAGDRYRVHRALAEATDAATDPDRHAWHRALATAGPDEGVAAELEQSAGRAQARGGLAAAAAFLTRSTELTADPRRRVRRALDAAVADLQAGALDDARDLLAIVEEGPLDDMQRARADVAHARLAFVSRRAREAMPLLLAAARRLEPLDPELARETYLDAFSAGQFAARLTDAAQIDDLARAARAAPRRADAETTAGDLILDAFAALTEDYSAAVPVARRAVARARADAGSQRARLEWLRHGSVLALELWDDESTHALTGHQLRIARTTGALGELPFVLDSRTSVLALCGDLAAAGAHAEEARSVQQSPGAAEEPYGTVIFVAWRGREREARDLVDVKLRLAHSRGEGIGVATAQYAQAVLCNGLGRHEEALAAARNACEDPHELVVHNWALPELVEAAARTGNGDLGARALRALTRKAQASGTDWALGMEARSRALLSTGSSGEDRFRAAIGYLNRTTVRGELARAHLLFGEWLRASGRRAEALVELDTAYRMLGAMGVEGFAERARRELQAAGATLPGRVLDTHGDLTAQEERIARLARDGLSNPEIGAELFISARTVEWHLRKVFMKLDITSRRQLRRVIPEARRPSGL
jgi:DNA-binding CsgD family transcriptional regulator